MEDQFAGRGADAICNANTGGMKYGLCPYWSAITPPSTSCASTSHSTLSLSSTPISAGIGCSSQAPFSLSLAIFHSVIASKGAQTFN